jgi:hypothetical protein
MDQRLAENSIARQWRPYDDAVERHLGGGDAGGLGADLAGVLDTIASHGEADSALLFLLKVVG